MTLMQRQTLMNAFFTSQFSHYHFVWMYHNRAMKNRIDSLYRKFLWSFTVIWSYILRTYMLFQICKRTLKCLATERCYMYRNWWPTIVRDLFKMKTTGCTLRQLSNFFSQRVGNGEIWISVGECRVLFQVSSVS